MVSHNCSLGSSNSRKANTLLNTLFGCEKYSSDLMTSSWFFGKYRHHTSRNTSYLTEHSLETQLNYNS
eukprot:m.83420 g.83420  ORF g.83420 m.83420 type:complete len:68 (-) comp12921_c0_seq1:20-223(-)